MEGLDQELLVSVLQEDDGRWIATVPTIAGCLAYGSDRAEAVRSVMALARQVITERIEHGEPA